MNNSKMYGGATLELTKYFEKRRMFGFDSEVFMSHPELFGMNPNCFMFISHKKKYILKYVTGIKEYYNIKKLIEQFYYSSECVLEVNNIGLRFLMESGYFTKFVLLGYNLFEDLREKNKMYDGKNGEELMKIIFKEVLGSVKYVDFENCITYCKEYNNENELEKKINEINEYIKIQKILFGSVHSLKERNELIEKISDETKFLNKGKRNNIKKKLKYDMVDDLYKTLMKTLTKNEKLDEDNLMNILKNLYQHSEFAMMKYISELISTYDRLEMKQVVDKLKIIREKTREQKNMVFTYLENIVKKYDETLEDIEKCKLTSYNCKNSEFKNKRTTEIKYSIKTVMSYLIASHIEMYKHEQLYNPILVNGMTMSYYYDYGMANYTDDNVDQMIILMTEDILNYLDISKIYKCNPDIYHVLDSYMEFNKYVNIKGPISFHSDYTRVNYMNDGINIEFTACGEIAVLNLIRFFKNYGIEPYTEKMRKIINIEKTDIQILEFTKELSNITGLVYFLETEDGYLYNMYTSMENILSCLNYIYFGKINENAIFDEIITQNGIKSIEYYETSAIINDIITMTFDFGNINMKASNKHAYLWYSEKNSTEEKPFIIDEMTSMIEIIDNPAILNYLMGYKGLLETLHYLTVEKDCIFEMDFNEEIANVLIDHTKQDRILNDMALEIIHKYGTNSSRYSIKFTERMFGHYNMKSDLIIAFNQIYSCMSFNPKYFLEIIQLEDSELIDNIIRYANTTQQKIFNRNTLKQTFNTKDISLINIVLEGEINSNEGIHIYSNILIDFIFVFERSELIFQLFTKILNEFVRYIENEQIKQIKRIKRIHIKKLVKYANKHKNDEDFTKNFNKIYNFIKNIERL
jgi:hypothetical protein